MARVHSLWLMLNRLSREKGKMEENDKSKIRTNGRPKMDVAARKSDYIKFRVNEAERKIFENLHQRFAPHLSEAAFARTKILDGNITLFGIRDLPDKEKELLKEIALLGNQFKMVASRNNITLTQERQFKEDAQKIREILNSTHNKILEYQEKELHYFNIGAIIEELEKVILDYEKSKGEELLINEIRLICKKLNSLYESILTHKK